MTGPSDVAAAAAGPAAEGGCPDVRAPAEPGLPPPPPALNDAPPGEEATEQGPAQAAGPPAAQQARLPVWGTLRSADAYQRLDDEPIGIGQYGEVASAFDKDTGLHVALKKIRMVRPQSAPDTTCSLSTQLTPLPPPPFSSAAAGQRA